MNTKFDWRNAGKAFMIILSASYFAFSNYIPVSGLFWNLIAIALFLGAILWHFMDLQFSLNDKTPKIDVVAFPVLDDVKMDFNLPEAKGIYHITGISHMAHVIFANKPKNRTNQNSVVGVRAEISYLDADKNFLFQVQGRWSHSDQPTEIRKGQRVTLESTDFPNNGAPRSLDLIIKYPEDNYCYAYDNNSYDAAFYLHPSYEIRHKHFFIQVQLFGAFIQDRIWQFEVVTKGKKYLFATRKEGDESWINTRTSIAKKIVAKKKVAKRIPEKTRKR